MIISLQFHKHVARKMLASVDRKPKKLLFHPIKIICWSDILFRIIIIKPLDYSTVLSCNQVMLKRGSGNFSVNMLKIRKTESETAIFKMKLKAGKDGKAQTGKEEQISAIANPTNQVKNDTTTHPHTRLAGPA